MLGASLLVHNDAPRYTEVIDFYWRLDGVLTFGLIETRVLIPPDLAICLAGAAFADYVVDPERGNVAMPKWEKLAIFHVRPNIAEMLEVGHVDIMRQAYQDGTPYPEVKSRTIADPRNMIRKYLT
jgi:hypothetical protein